MAPPAKLALPLSSNCVFILREQSFHSAQTKLQKMSGRVIAIGDIHGCALALDTLLRAIQPQPDDTIVALGDYIDRGPQSADVLEIFTNLISSCRLVPLIGNHEMMMMQALESKTSYSHWMECGGATTVASYGNRISNLPQHHRLFLNHCLQFYETETHFFIHANYDPNVALDEQPEQLALWQHIIDDIPDPHFSGKTAIVGHTPQIDGNIRDLGHVKIIDTFCYGNMWLTGYDVDTGHIWQTTNRGELRELAPENTNVNRESAE
jgi:serine/threonine protein phosphatase 1